ncbi:MAG: glutaredoxin domain-containing protein [Acidiferrobacterales bacterium]
MTRVKIYSTGICPFCQKAKGLLEKWSIPFTEVRIDLDRAAMREYSQVTNGARTVPQIVIDGRCIGGFTELTELHMEGALDALMEQARDGASR